MGQTMRWAFAAIAILLFASVGFLVFLGDEDDSKYDDDDGDVIGKLAQEDMEKDERETAKAEERPEPVQIEEEPKKPDTPKVEKPKPATVVETSAEVDLENGKVAGYIIDDNHEPVAGATIELFIVSRAKYFATSNAKGRFLISDIVPKTYLIRVIHPEFETRVIENEIYVDPARVREIEPIGLTSSGAAIIGTVQSSDGKPLAGFLVSASGGGNVLRNVAGESDEKSARTETDGTFRLGGLRPGLYIVRFGNTQPVAERISEIVSIAAQQEVVANHTAGSLIQVRGRITFANVALIEASVKFYARPEVNGIRSASRLGYSTTKTDKDGNYTISLSPGRHQLYARGERLFFEVSDRNPEEVHDFTLGTTGVTGVVVTSDGKQVPARYSLKIALRPENSTGIERSNFFDKYLDSTVPHRSATGAKFRVPAPPGRYSLLITAPGFATTTMPVVLIQGRFLDMGDITVVGRGFNRQLRFLGLDPTIMEDSVASLIDSSGVERLLIRLTPQGDCSAYGLGSGHYRVHLYLPSGVRQEYVMEISDDSPAFEQVTFD